MIWEMRISATVNSPPDDISDVLDQLLTTVAALPSVLGVTTFGDQSSGEIGARYDLEAEDFEQAIEKGTAIFHRAVREPGIPPVTIQHAEVTAEREFATNSPHPSS